MLDRIHGFFRFFLKKKIFRFLISGGTSAAVDFFLFVYLFNEVFRKQDVTFYQFSFKAYSFSLLISYLCGSFTSFLLNKYFVFSVPTSGKRQFLKSLPVYILAFFGNLFLLKFFVEFLNIWPSISRGMAAVAVAFLTFNLHKYFTFRNKNKSEDDFLPTTE